MLPPDTSREFDLDLAPMWPEDDSRLEPAFLAGPLWIEFAEADRISLEPAHARLQASLLVGFDEPDQVDLERAQQRAEEPPPTPAWRAGALGMVGAFGVHLLPLVMLLGWSTAPGELAAAIPVQLVIEQAPPEPPPPKMPLPVPARLASVSMGETAGQPEQSAAIAEHSADKPQQTRLTAALPKTKPLPNDITSLPQPEFPKDALAGSPSPSGPEPAPRSTPGIKQVVSPRPPPRPQSAPTAAQVIGPAATRDDEYLSHVNGLINRQSGLLPASLLAGRVGVAVVDILVLGDGTIARIRVIKSSGYRDIDSKIEQMVAAVRRFPPLPQRFEEPNLLLNYELSFPPRGHPRG